MANDHNTILKDLILSKNPNMLVAARKMGLSLPVFAPRERKISSNPAGIILDFYKARSHQQTKHIFSDLNFDVSVGDRVGILGRNGAGKTTLLRVIADIIKNTEGQLVKNGDARGLFNVSYGMDKDATGLENIYLRGLQMGIGLKKLKSLIPEVVEFTELGDAIHQLFSTYSTGMQLRLAVAISTMISPEILLMDEWIGSGDQEFQNKVKKRMERLVDESNALILASHNKGLLRSNCNKGWVMDYGKIVFMGDIADAIKYYSEEVVNAKKS